MWKEFRDFAMRGNVLDLAIGVIIGAAFGRIVTSLVNDILMPPLGVVLGRVDFSNLFFSLSDKHFNSLADAKAAGATHWKPAPTPVFDSVASWQFVQSHGNSPPWLP